MSCLLGHGTLCPPPQQQAASQPQHDQRGIQQPPAFVEILCQAKRHAADNVVRPALVHTAARQESQRQRAEQGVGDVVDPQAAEVHVGREDGQQQGGQQRRFAVKQRLRQQIQRRYGQRAHHDADRAQPHQIAPEPIYRFRLEIWVQPGERRDTAERSQERHVVGGAEFQHRRHEVHLVHEEMHRLAKLPPAEAEGKGGDGEQRRQFAPIHPL